MATALKIKDQGSMSMKSNHFYDSLEHMIIRG